MSRILRFWRLGAVAVSCLAIGAGASAITSAGSATGHPVAGKHRQTRGLTPRRLLARAVHGDLVVATKSGFATITLDRGVAQSVNGQTLTLTEGTKQLTGKTVTLTIPANAWVRDDRHKATLADIQRGQRVIVVQAPHRTLVIARPPRTP